MQAVLERLTEEGAGAEKSFLGSYKGAAGVWERIVRGYEGSSEPAGLGYAWWPATCSAQPLPAASAADCRAGLPQCPPPCLLPADAPASLAPVLHVAEAAQALGRNVDYEVPFLKKAGRVLLGYLQQGRLWQLSCSSQHWHPAWQSCGLV